MVDRTGRPGVWTTDLAGGDVRPYVDGLDETGTTIRDARLVGDDVVLIREGPTTPAPELWLVSQTRPPRLLLDGVDSFVVRGDREVVAVRDREASRAIWRVPTDGAAPASIAELPVAGSGPSLGPFGFAISPDGRTVAGGWVGGPLEIVGPAPSHLEDVGAPLVVADDGRLVAVTGRAGEAYVVEGDGMAEFAPADSDPLAIPGTGVVAWPTVGDDGRLRSVEVHDLVAGTSETYALDSLATNVREVSERYVVLEATAFDPLARTVAVVDRRDGRVRTFEAAAPNVE